jgi:hypothetical protein
MYTARVGSTDTVRYRYEGVVLATNHKPKRNPHAQCPVCLEAQAKVTDVAHSLAIQEDAQRFPIVLPEEAGINLVQAEVETILDAIAPSSEETGFALK